jgi:hypothetical protein
MCSAITRAEVIITRTERRGSCCYSVPSAIFPKNALPGLLSLAPVSLQGGYRGDSVLSSVALSHAATTLASKGLGAANRLIVACDTLKLRATSACASPFASLCMASRR